MTRFPPNWLQQGTYAASVDRRLIGALWPAPASVGGAVSVASGMTLNIAPGQVVVPTANNTGGVLCSWDAQEQVTLAAAPASGSNRIDLIVAQARGNDLDGGSNNDFVFQAVTGTAAATPAAPAVPANAAALAQVYVPGASASVTAGNITDRRPGALAVSSTGLRLAYVAVSGNQGPSSGAAEVLCSGLVTPAVNIPSATRLVRVEFSWRAITGTAGEGAVIRIREGSGITGTIVYETVQNFLPSGMQVASGSGGVMGRTYAPGQKQVGWCVTLQGIATGATLIGNVAGPLWLQATDAGG